MMISKFPLVLAAASLTFVAACDPATAPNNNQKAQQGALIGAGVGAVGALLTNRDRENRDRNRAVVLSSVVGAAAGAAIGNQLDKQAAELEASLGNNVGVVNNGDNLVVTLSQDILFATNSTAVSGVSQNDLRTVASSLNRYPDTTVNVIGHTDNVGEADFNFDLSQRRAQAVSSILISSGVAPSRVRSIGAGENQPIATNGTPEGRQMNRRVEIVITPNS